MTTTKYRFTIEGEAWGIFEDTDPGPVMLAAILKELGAHDRVRTVQVDKIRVKKIGDRKGEMKRFLPT